LLSELGKVVGENGRLMAGTRYGDVSEAGVDEVRVDPGIGVHKDALGGKPLGTVAGDSVAVVEVAMLGRIEIDFAA
jgi:hypothetical protein